VEGERCDRCRPGTIYLDNENPLGCQPCFCFGKSRECRENFWNIGQVGRGNFKNTKKRGSRGFLIRESRQKYGDKIRFRIS